ncbi:hypothetical protein [Sphingomonas sp.]|uniref:hypothetical protein n=1 Tax=Sphingomonas sp. TaxID=28214 RepID=UPI003B3A5EC6
MLAKPMFGLLLAATAVSSTFAQTSATGTTGRTPAEEYQRGYSTPPMPNQAAINAAGAPVTAALNNQGAAVSQADNTAIAADQAQYEADRAAYMDALVKHDRAVNRTDARYVRQQNAYADAMRVWRAQAYACKHGNSRACKAPTPNPADFY